MSKLITLQMTIDRARSLALVVCKCGHMENNHFDCGKCAHCECKAIEEKPIQGLKKMDK